MLALLLWDALGGEVAGKYFPDADHTRAHHIGGLLLALPVPLHVIFIGLIVQKKWLSPPMARMAWIGIVTSGVWLGIALAIRLFF